MAEYWVVAADEEKAAAGRRAAERAYPAGAIRALAPEQAEARVYKGEQPVGALFLTAAYGALRALLATLDDGAPVAALAAPGELPEDLARAATLGRLAVHPGEALGQFSLAAAPALAPAWRELKPQLARAVVDQAARRSIAAAAEAARPPARALWGAALDGEVDPETVQAALARLGAGDLPAGLLFAPRAAEQEERLARPAAGTGKPEGGERPQPAGAEGGEPEGFQRALSADAKAAASPEAARGALCFPAGGPWAEALGTLANALGAEARPLAEGTTPGLEDAEARWWVLDLGPGDGQRGLARIRAARTRHPALPILALASNPGAGRAAMAAGADSYHLTAEEDPRRAWRSLRGAMRGIALPSGALAGWARAATLQGAEAAAARRALGWEWLAVRGDEEVLGAAAPAAPGRPRPRADKFPRGRGRPPRPPPPLDLAPALGGLRALLSARGRTLDESSAAAILASAPPAQATAPRVVVAADAPGQLAGVVAAALQLTGARAELLGPALEQEEDAVQAAMQAALGGAPAAGARQARLAHADLVVVVDEGRGGPWDLIRAARRASLSAPLCVVSARPDGAAVARALRAGADAWISPRREEDPTTEDRSFVQRLAAAAARHLDDPERTHLAGHARRLGALLATPDLGHAATPLGAPARRALWLLRLSSPAGGLKAARVARLLDFVPAAREEVKALAEAARAVAESAGASLDAGGVIRAAEACRTRADVVRALGAALDTAFLAARAMSAEAARRKKREERKRVRAEEEKRRRDEERKKAKESKRRAKQKEKERVQREREKRSRKIAAKIAAERKAASEPPGAPQSPAAPSTASPTPGQPPGPETGQR